jgi:hypothetical protein
MLLRPESDDEMKPVAALIYYETSYQLKVANGHYSKILKFVTVGEVWQSADDVNEATEMIFLLSLGSAQKHENGTDSRLLIGVLVIAS